MARTEPILTAFNAGEFSPAVDGRVDLAKYSQGAKRLENFVPLVQGPVQRRGGTRYVTHLRDESTRALAIKFEFSATQFYVIELGHLYIRVFTNHAAVESSPGVIYEAVSPYAVSDLWNPDGTTAMKFVQSGDVLYIANMYGTYAPRKLTRLADASWAFSIYEPLQGPLLEQNADESLTIQASAQTGAVTLTASGPVFSGDDVGRLVRLDVTEFTTAPWETAKAYAGNDLVRSDGKTYKAVNSNTSGTAPPVHERGLALDGKGAVGWRYQNAGYGLARITAVTDSMHAFATVVADAINGLLNLPVEVTVTPTPRWQLGAWSTTSGYPRCVTFFRSRLWWFGELRFWGSVPDDFENMSGDFFNEVTPDCAISRILTAQDVNAIQWAIGDAKLVIGTGGGEFACGELSTSEPLGPGNFAIVPQGKKRARSVDPIVAGSSILYVQRAGRKLLSTNFSIESDSYVSTDLAVLADRITRTGITALAYQSEPNSVVWVLLANGQLRGFTYDLEQEVSGWHRHPIGGTDVVVESIVCGPSPDGGRDELWLFVRRTIAGQVRRCVEYMERPFEGRDQDGTAGDLQSSAFYVDCGITYSGAPATVIPVAHLEGQPVQILADGAREADQVVTGGIVTLSRLASVVHVGLRYLSLLVPMRLVADGKIARVNALTVVFVDSLGGHIGRYGDEQSLEPISLRTPSTPMGQAEPIASGPFRYTFPGNYERETLIGIIQDAPLPMTVASLVPEIGTGE